MQNLWIYCRFVTGPSSSRLTFPLDSRDSQVRLISNTYLAWLSFRAGRIFALFKIDDLIVRAYMSHAAQRFDTGIGLGVRKSQAEIQGVK
jgi:hypothetical protein